MLALLSCIFHLSFQSFLQGHENCHRDNQGRQDKIAAAEELKTDHRADKTNDCGQMALRFSPLIHKDGYKERRHGKINAGHIEGQNQSQSCAHQKL